jgi:hypothetical protein
MVFPKREMWRWPRRPQWQNIRMCYSNSDILHGYMLKGQRVTKLFSDMYCNQHRLRSYRNHHDNNLGLQLPTLPNSSYHYHWRRPCFFNNYLSRLWSNSDRPGPYPTSVHNPNWNWSYSGSQSHPIHNHVRHKLYYRHPKLWCRHCSRFTEANSDSPAKTPICYCIWYCAHCTWHFPHFLLLT